MIVQSGLKPACVTALIVSRTYHLGMLLTRYRQVTSMFCFLLQNTHIHHLEADPITKSTQNSSRIRVVLAPRLTTSSLCRAILALSTQKRPLLRLRATTEPEWFSLQCLLCVFPQRPTICTNPNRITELKTSEILAKCQRKEEMPSFQLYG